MGLKTYVEDTRASYTVTTIYNAPGIDPLELRKLLGEKYHLVIAGGLVPVKKETFRIGHLGYIGRGEVLNCLSGLELGLKALGFPIQLGAGLAAAQEVFATEL